MAHRHDTRSNKPPTAIIDLTQDAPLPIPRRTRSKRHAAPLPEGNTGPASAPKERREVSVLKESVRVPKERKSTAKKQASIPNASVLPCLNTSLPGAPEMLMCAICFGSLSASREPTATQCGHVFCKECLTASLTKRRRCPTCQSESRISKCVRLYFS